MKKIDIASVFDLDGLTDEIVSTLQSGGVALMSSDTCYGFIGDALNGDARSKIAYLKSMPADKPISIAVSDFDQLYEFGDFDEYGRNLAVQFLPGKLTLIVDSKDPRLGETVGIRMPDHGLMREVALKLGGPIFTTSANKHGEPTCYVIDLIEEQLGDKFNEIDLVLDGGILELVDPSTIVRLLDHKIEIVREGDLASILREQFGA